MGPGCLPCVQEGCLEKKLGWYQVGVYLAVMRAGQAQTWCRDSVDVIKVPNQLILS